MGVLVSYKITRGITLVVGRVNDWVWGDLGVFLGVFGGSRGVTGCLVDPYRTLFAPLEVLYGTRFSSKHHILVQLAYVNRVGITDPF